MNSLAKFKIIPLTCDEQELKAHFQHLKIHQAESSPEFVFTPCLPEEETEDFKGYQQSMTSRLPLPTTEAGWSRIWVLKDGDQTVGDLTLSHRIPLKSSLHRAHIMMGIRQAYRGQGNGRKMIETALSFAKKQEHIEWVDLEVFSHNLPAITLYKSFGFKENFTINDRFRVFGQKINDINMSLATSEI